MTSRLSPQYDGTRIFLTLLFVVWGIGGFILALVAITAAGALASAIMATAGGILWIGGMVFFGIAALMASPSFVMTDIASRGTYRKIPYRIKVDGTVEAKTEAGVESFNSWKSFKTAIKGQ